MGEMHRRNCMNSRLPIAIVGAGMAGLACAERLTEAGHTVRLFDKGRGAGGRMSTRRIETPGGEACFDHGAAFFTATDPAFKRCVDGWIAAGRAALWPEAGVGAVVGIPTMNAPLKAMAAELDVLWSAQVTGLERRSKDWMLEIGGSSGVKVGPYAAVIVAIPPEQATHLLTEHSFDLAIYSTIARSKSVWATMVAFEGPARLPSSDFAGDDIIARAVRETGKPGRSAIECWTLQATTDWSTRRLSVSAAEVSMRMLTAFASRAEAALPPTIVLQSHLWRFARAAKPTLGSNWHSNAALGLCGDWVAGDGVEAAWMSGVRLAERIISLSASALERNEFRPVAL